MDAADIVPILEAMSSDRPHTLSTLRKHRMRELAMQVLFFWDSHGSIDQEGARRLVTEVAQTESIANKALEMAMAAWESRQVADQWVERIAPQWPPRRQPGVDRNILRLAIWELTHRPTPHKVVVDEAIELAKDYSTEQSASFVNGVMDTILKEHRALIDPAALSDQSTTEPTALQD
ncbi:MAG: transcription antitermination factor NusB [Phycisphaerales bacterium]|jgi:N utilization substance protein B|nr:transcription antitermination factor NusB [Phycisphaerales bacterium]